MAPNGFVSADSPITIKVTYNGSTKKLKVPLGELTPARLPAKLRLLLGIDDAAFVTFERYSDSAGAYITLEPSNASAWRTLFRAAKAKQKLRLRATTSSIEGIPLPAGDLANLFPSQLATAQVRQRLSKLNLNSAFAGSETTLNANNINNIMDLPNPSTIFASAAEGEAPLPSPFPVVNGPPALPKKQAPKLPHPFDFMVTGKAGRPSPLKIPGCTWSVFCNSCDTALPGEHWHCNTCDQGDYDLCQYCLDQGKHCKSDDHWMVKRTVEDGKVVASTTERVPPKVPAMPAAPTEIKTVPKTMPGAYAEEKAEEKKPEPMVLAPPTRTCNSCVKVFKEDNFVTCQTCDDYDLCMECHCSNRHGHHPGHPFRPAVEGTTVRPLEDFLLAPGRNIRHAALCDNCDKTIYGVRHKCLVCPDWDYCSDCYKSAGRTHSGHRFVPIYEPLPDASTCPTRHLGIYCDGPLCSGSGAGSVYISGVRYKCAICHDLDFCANCEASPKNRHNRTHPLIKFKTPVRDVKVTTLGEDETGAVMSKMGDQNFAVPQPPSTVSPVQPIVEVKPAEEATTKPTEKIEIKDLLAEPIVEKIKVQNLLSPIAPIMDPGKKPVNAPTTELNAHFVRDSVTDGTKMLPNKRFVQTWRMKNPGPHAWPAGCSVRYVGGDNMLNVPQDSSAPGVAEAVSSNATSNEIPVGMEVSFSVMMKAPTRPGTSISYWRLKSEDGVPFGHRLWCHIEVSNAVEQVAESAVEQKPVPDAALMHLLEEMNKRRQAVADAVKDTEARVKRLREMQAEGAKATNAAIEDQDRQKRVQMLRALHAARLATVSAEKKEAAANMQPRLPLAPLVISRGPPPAPTVEDALDKEDQIAIAAAVPAALEAAGETNNSQSSSTMVFPKLEKESPASSMHNDAEDALSVAGTGITRTETQTTAGMPPFSRTESFDDAGSICILDGEEGEELSSSDDDGFLTDEEYDILDASDEEGHP